MWISARVNTQFRRQVHIQHFITLIARTAGPFTKFRGKGFRPVAPIPARVDRRSCYTPARTYVETGILVYTACNFTPANTHAFCILLVTRCARPVKYGRDCCSYVTRMCGAPRGELYQLPCLRIAHNTSLGDRHKILHVLQSDCVAAPNPIRVCTTRSASRVKPFLRARILSSILDSWCIDWGRAIRSVEMLISSSLLLKRKFIIENFSLDLSVCDCGWW